jgi:hypothetical protein
MLAIKTKTFRDLIDESPFTKSDVVTIQVSILQVYVSEERRRRTAAD